MLICVTNIENLPYTALMVIYEQSNRTHARDRYPRMDPSQALWRAEQDFWAYLEEDFFSVPGAAVFLWQDRATAVSALRLQPWEDGLLLTGLETAPDHRRRGYAARLMKGVLTDQNQPVYSHVRKENAASLTLHESLGFRRIRETAVYLDGRTDKDAWTLRLN